MKLPFFKKQELRIPMPEVLTIQDIVAPSSIKVTGSYLQFGERLAKSFFIFSYPRYLTTGWFSPIINLDVPMDISFFAHPADTSKILGELRKKITAVQAEMIERQEKGLIRSPELEIAYRDMEELRDQLQTAQEKMFNFGLYLTVYADKEDELREIETSLRSILEGRLIYIKPALYQQKEGFISTSPYNLDMLLVHTAMNTGPLSSSFPFISFDLSSNQGILYGINMHNNSLILFDRFEMENANACVFGKAGVGKSIDKNQNVLCRYGKKTCLTKIGSLVENLIKKHGATKIDKEMEGVLFPDLQVYTFNKNLKGKWAPVTVAARKKISKRSLLYKITTKSGRQITVTPDHNIIVLRNGKIRAMRGQTIKVGESIPVPRFISEPKSSRKNVNPISLVNNWPKNLPQTIKLDENFLMLLGLITSEGYIRKNALNVYNDDKKIQKTIQKAAETIGAKITPIYEYKNGEKIKVRGLKIKPNVYAKLIIALGAGGKAGEKRVPPLMFTLSNKQIASYLQAYFAGDGGVEENGIVASSKSKGLISDLAYLLLRFGIIGRISRRKKRATNSNHKGDWYWFLTISGQKDLKLYTKHIGFITKEKNKKLQKILGRKYNTNVDIIPSLKPIFENIYEKLYSCSEIKSPTNLSDLKRETFAPSRKVLKKFIEDAEKRIAEIKKARDGILELKHLPKWEKFVKKAAKRKKHNRLLWQELGSSWAVMKNKKFVPMTTNMLRAMRTVNERNLRLAPIRTRIYNTFQTLGESLKDFDTGLWAASTQRQGNTSYQKIWRAGQYLGKRHRQLQSTIIHVQQKLSWLKSLANSDLFWDPIIKIEKIKNKDDYVYDLQVDNEVFLAGHGGMFVHNSYAVKLEILRSLMLGIPAIIVDPENEYEFLADAVSGSFFNISLASPSHVNPFDLPIPREDENPEDVLRSNIINLVGLMRIMLGGLTPEEDAIMDRALAETYAAKDITPDSNPATWPKRTPLMSDLESVLETMEGAESLVRRIRKFTTGTYASFFNQPSNVSMDNKLVIFGIRDMEEELKQMAMFIIMRYIWKTITSQLKKRILIIDEAWWLMQTEDGASFLYGTAKRARKYWLGVTTITQDVNDFMKSDYGQPIVANSSIQILMKQSPATIDIVQKTFNLTEEEKMRLLEASIGEGLFFAGAKHVAMRVVASYAEDQVITTAPEEVVKIRKAKQELKQAT